ncbi:MAG: response regulator transcription factor [Verrucomicrobia bacterium]|nr:response regulator transcription factor [Verrucomicrobiota bacterium]
MTAPLRTLLVDDERLARRALRSLLAAHPEVAIVGEAATVAEAAAVAAGQPVDLIFLDVQMPPGTGFDLLPLLSPPPAIIFVTAHDSHAVRAFEVSAADYLLKPLSPARLAAAIQRIRHRAPTAPAPLRPDDTLVLRDRQRVRRVALAEIAAIEADGHYARVYLADEPPMFVQRGIASWAAQLPAPGFLRVDRSLIVNLARVRSLNLQSRSLTELSLMAGGNPLRLGRVASARLRAALAV